MVPVPVRSFRTLHRAPFAINPGIESFYLFRYLAVLCTGKYTLFLEVDVKRNNNFVVYSWGDLLILKFLHKSINHST